SPNGTGRTRPQEALLVFRLYQKLTASALGDVTAGSSFLSSILDPLRGVVRTARNVIREGVGGLQGRLLVKEYQMAGLILQRFEESAEVRSRFSYTRDGFFIDTPFRNAKGITHFRIAGRTRRSIVFVDGVPVDGDAALKDFTDMVDDYLYPPDGRSCPDFELY